jgi:hypothetical protein
MPAEISKVIPQIKKALAANDISRLFLDVLNWDFTPNQKDVKTTASGAQYIADKAKVPIWLVTAATQEEFDSVDKLLRMQSFERLVVWNTPQGRIWFFPERTNSGTKRSRTEEKNIEAIAQRLAELRFEPDSEDPTILDVKDLLQRSFSVEAVTEKFYKEFKAIHDRLGGQRGIKGKKPLLRGLPDVNTSRWYASVLLNRLMFLYFLQRKGFLDNDQNYLENRMRSVQNLYGKGNFYTFYSSFLIPLFTSAIGSPRWESLSTEMKSLVGRVPYLNGGVFAQHPLEKMHTIELDDDIFNEIFGVFQRYRWHLDEAAHAEDQSLPQINPDILGHIFERYVNEKTEDTGAFYTPSDVTRWMTTRAVGSVLLQYMAALGVDIGAQVAKDPERFLPSEHFVGRQEAAEWIGASAKPGTQLARSWSLRVPAGRGLPAETAWEVRDRLRHAEQMCEELSTGKFSSAGELFRFNLNNSVVLADAMRKLTPDQLQQYWDKIFSVTIIDPTCGSGAFLLAALAFLEELALDVLSRGEEFLHDKRIKSPSFVAEFANMSSGQRRLSIRTKLIINCLYGTDISGEAVEIARLRLYLSLVATATAFEDLKPLPDLEFNLSEGNLLVGVNNESEGQLLIGSSLWAQAEWPVVKMQIQQLASAIADFHGAQEASDYENIESHRLLAKKRSEALNEQLNVALHKAMAPEAPYQKWLKSHEPLHYLAQFPAVMLSGGFDVAIGNPPYIARSKVSSYRYGGMPAAECPDIYAPCTTRASGLVKTSGSLAFILPISVSFNDDFVELRDHLNKRFETLATLSFGKRPDTLFRGVQVRNTIVIGLPDGDGKRLATGQQHWTSAFRPALLSTIRLTPVDDRSSRWERYEGNIVFDLVKNLESIGAPISVVKNSEHSLYFKNVATYWLPVSLAPFRSLDDSGDESSNTAKARTLSFSSEAEMLAMLAIFSSRLGWLLWQATADDFNVTLSGLLEWRIDLQAVPKIHAKLVEVGKKVRDELMKNHSARVWNWQSGMWLENYDNRKISNVTDGAVLALLEAAKSLDRYDEFEAAYWRCMKATRESAGVVYGARPF